MNTPSLTTASSAPPPKRRIVDVPTRVVHALIAICFAVAYLTGDAERFKLVHITMGYTLAGLLTWRVLMGLFGPRANRLSALGGKLKAGSVALKNTFGALKQGPISVLWDAAKGRPLHNWLIALSVALLLGLIAPVVLSGYGTENDWTGEWLGEVHEFLANGMLAVVLAHIALVVGLSLLRRKNLVAPMVTGRTDGPGPDLVKKPMAWLGALILAAVLGFWAYQWQTAPMGGDGGGAEGGDRAQVEQSAPAASIFDRKSRHHDDD